MTYTLQLFFVKEGFHVEDLGNSDNTAPRVDSEPEQAQEEAQDCPNQIEGDFTLDELLRAHRRAIAEQRPPAPGFGPRRK